MLTHFRCLKWAVIAANHPYPYNDGHAAKNLSYYQQFADEIDDTGITWTISINQITKFERQNRLDLS